MKMNQDCKQTEFGVVPNSWDVLSLSDITSEIGDGIHATPVYSARGEYHFINGNNLRNGRIAITDDTKAVDETEYKRHRKSLSKESILMSINGTLGNLALFNGEKVILGKSASYLNVREGVSTRFVFHSLHADYVLRQFFGGVTGTTIGNLGLGTIRGTKICVPNMFSEQQAIAEVLTDADAWIESLEKLIAKKRLIKQGLMQQLLTGKRRLPGFAGKWVSKTLSMMVVSPVTDGPHMTPQFLEDGIPFLSVNNLANNCIDITDLRYISRSDHELFSRKCKPQRGDLLLGKAASVGKVAIVDSDFEFNIWSPIALIRLKSTQSVRFIFYKFQSLELVRQIALLTNSSSQGNIGMSDVAKLSFLLPPIEEQNAIATILFDIDAAILELEKTASKARCVKQGMMQNLLTGRIRLK